MSAPDPDAILAEMQRDAEQYIPSPARPTLQRVRYKHEDCIDCLIANPTITQVELAARYGMTQGWMSIIMNSDAFKMKLEERRRELVDPVILATVNEKFAALANRSVEILMEKLSKPADQVPDKLALEAAALGARVTGLDREQRPTGEKAADHLAAISHRLIDLYRSAGGPVDVPARWVGEGDPA